MAFPKWRHIGTVTTTIDHPTTGPTVLTPQMEFNAPLAAVAHLKKIGKVVEVKEKAENPGPNRRPKRPLPAPRKGRKPKAKPPEGDAEPKAPVVESKSSSSATEKGNKSSRPGEGKGKEEEIKPQESSGKRSRSKK